LQHVGEAGEVGLQPVLLGVELRGETELPICVDVVLELGEFAARIDLDRAGEIALSPRSPPPAMARTCEVRCGEQLTCR